MPSARSNCKHTCAFLCIFSLNYWLVAPGIRRGLCYTRHTIPAHKAISYIQLPRYNRGGKEYKQIVEQIRVLVHARLAHFNQRYNAPIGTVSIRKQRTRWGSASTSHNLSFNYRIVFLPAHLADYIIVHELCHLIEHNHSPRFWAQMARVLPDYQALRKELRRYRF